MQETLAIAICLVVMVIFLFLRTVSATLIPALAVPVSLIGTCAAMYVFGFSINNMTLLALTLSVGFVVDDAIVMLENIVRHIEGGMRPFEAALKGAREIGFTIISITFSLIAVFIPVLLMGGMVGRVFREFAVTIAVAIIVSGFVSLTLTPMLCARVLRGTMRARSRTSSCACSRRCSAAGCGPTNGRSTRCSPTSSVMLLTFATLAAHVWLYLIIPKGFFPTEDTGFIFAIAPRAPRHLVRANGRAAAPGRRDHPRDKAVDYVNSTVGAGGPNPTTQLPAACSSRSSPRRSARKPRPRSSNACAAPPTPSPAWRCISRTSRTSTSPAAFPRASSNTRCNRAIPKRSYRSRPQMRDKIAQIEGLRDVTTDLYIKNPQMTIEVDREKAAVYGITIDQIRQELFNAFGARQVATIYTPTNDYQVILESQPKFQADDPLQNLFIKTNGAEHRRSGRRTGARWTAASGSRSLSAVTRMVPTVGPLQVNHQGNQPSVTISFNLAPGFSLGQAVDAIRAIERDATPADHGQYRLPGLRAGVPGIAQGAGRAGPGRDLCRLCGARHPVRKLHPSDHHHLRPAVGRRRRAADR